MGTERGKGGDSPPVGSTEAEVEERKAEKTLRREAAAAAVWIALGKGGKGHTWIAK